MALHVPARILHAPTNTGNHPWGLSRAERELGLVSDLADFNPAYMAYSSDYTFDLAGKGLAARARIRLSFLARAAPRYDVFHYNGGAPLVAWRHRGRTYTELGLLKALGKTIVVTWQGCDVRPRSTCVGCTRPHCDEQAPHRAPDAVAMLRHADRALYLNPDLAPYLPGATFLPYASLDVTRVEPAAWVERREVRIAHAPTNPSAKGTAHVLAAVAQLQAQGLPVELELIEGVTNAEARRRIADADILVDQLLIGWYGGVALEAMALGKPVVCFIDEATNPFGEELPIVRADPASVATVLERLVGDAELRRAAGRASREFALREHDPRVLVRRAYAGLIPIPADAASDAAS
jgi:hypothetical protein